MYKLEIFLNICENFVKLWWLKNPRTPIFHHFEKNHQQKRMLLNTDIFHNFGVVGS